MKCDKCGYHDVVVWSDRITFLVPLYHSLVPLMSD